MKRRTILLSLPVATALVAALLAALIAGGGAGPQPSVDPVVLRASVDRTRYPNAIAAGVGTAASPYTHSDGSGGITTSVNALAAGRGGLVELAPGEFTVSTGIVNRNHCVEIRGRAAGYNATPNATAEGELATKLAVAAGQAGFTIGKANNPQHASIENLYLYGSSNAAFSTSHVGIRVNEAIDQFLIQRVNFQELPIGLFFVTTGGGVADACRFYDCSFIDNYIGIYKDASVLQYFCRYRGNTIADNNAYGAIFLQDAGPGHNRFTENEVVRNYLTVGGADRAGLYVDTRDFVIGPGNSFLKNGITVGNVENNNTNSSPVDGLVLGPNSLRCRVIGNVFESHTTDGHGTGLGTAAGVRVRGDYAYIAGNSFLGNNADIIVESTAHFTIIDQPGATVTDGGTCTIVNGMSKNAGDPASAGNWSGVTPPDGTLIVDTTNQRRYWYHASLTGGRIEVVNPEGLTLWHASAARVITGNAITEGAASGQIGGVQAYQDTPASTDVFEYRVPLEAGTYAVTIWGIKANNRAKVDWTHNGAAWLNDQDWYVATAGTVNQSFTATLTVTRSGVQFLRCSVDGKNAASSNYYVLLSHTTIRKAA